MATLGDAVDLGTDALTEKYPDGLANADPEMVSALVLDAAYIELNNLFWEIHRHELERLMEKVGRLERVAKAAQQYLDTKTDAVGEKLQRALNDFEVHHLIP